VSRPGVGFSSYKRSARFDATYVGLENSLQKQVDKAIALLFANRWHPSLKVHPVKPDKYFWEAYANSGDRIIYIPDGDCLMLVDIIPHDKIGRYGKRPRER
jgi:hypothetical protein